MAAARPSRTGATPGVPADRESLQHLHDAVYLLAGAQRRLVRQRTAGGALSPERLRALTVLTIVREATPSQLAREAALRPNNVTTMINQLEANGVVRRRGDESDGRVSWISLTEKGYAEVDRLQASWNRELAAAFADVPDEDLETAGRVLERLALVFHSMADRPKQ